MHIVTQRRHGEVQGRMFFSLPFPPWPWYCGEKGRHTGAFVARWYVGIGYRSLENPCLWAYDTVQAFVTIFASFYSSLTIEWLVIMYLLLFVLWSVPCLLYFEFLSCLGGPHRTNDGFSELWIGDFVWKSTNKVFTCSTCLHVRRALIPTQ